MDGGIFFYFRKIYDIKRVRNAPVAQWIERLASDQEVRGSSPRGRVGYRFALIKFMEGNNREGKIESSAERGRKRIFKKPAYIHP